MALEFGKKACSLCRRRPRDEGGNGSCPLVPASRLQYAAQEEHGHDCLSFKLGDLKTNRNHLPRVHGEQMELI